MIPNMISPRIHTIFKEMNRSPDVPFLPGVSHISPHRTKEQGPQRTLCQFMNWSIIVVTCEIQ